MSVLDRLEALLAQATPERPWTRGTYDAESTSDVWAPGDPKTGAVSICDFATNADAALICGAVNALSALIACARALERVAEQQPKTLRMIESNGFVFDSIGSEPGNWQHLAFTIYTDLCEVETIALSALASLAEGQE